MDISRARDALQALTDALAGAGEQLRAGEMETARAGERVTHELEVSRASARLDAPRDPDTPSTGFGDVADHP